MAAPFLASPPQDISNTPKLPASLTGCGGILSCDGYFALVFGKKHQKWSFPKGHLNRNESMEDCAYREIKEETGIEPHQLPPPTKSMFLTKTWFLLFDLPTQLELTSPNDHEIAECRWMNRQEILQRWDSCNSGVRRYFSK